jgi:2'-5' RNA ligase
MADTSRLFVAVPLPAIVQETVQCVQREVRQTGLEASFPKPDALHITLHFIGNVDDARRDQIKEQLLAVRFGLLQASPTEHVQSFGRRKARMTFWVGVRCPALEDVARDIREAIGAPEETRAFIPHVTIARSRRPVRSGLRERIEGIEVPRSSWTIDSFNLYHSKLSSEGTTHTVLQRYLANAPSA